MLKAMTIELPISLPLETVLSEQSAPKVWRVGIAHLISSNVKAKCYKRALEKSVYTVVTFYVF